MGVDFFWFVDPDAADGGFDMAAAFFPCADPPVLADEEPVPYCVAAAIADAFVSSPFIGLPDAFSVISSAPSGKETPLVRV